MVSAMTSERSHLTIDTLSDDVLLRTFDSYRREYEDENGKWWWHVLVHRCERWRHIILACPGHLNLQLFANPKQTRRLDSPPALSISAITTQASFYKAARMRMTSVVHWETVIAQPVSISGSNSYHLHISPSLRWDHFLMTGRGDGGLGIGAWLSLLASVA